MSDEDEDEDEEEDDDDDFDEDDDDDDKPRRSRAKPKGKATNGRTKGGKTTPGAPWSGRKKDLLCCLPAASARVSRRCNGAQH